MIVAITGASGLIYGVRALDLLRAAGIETHLVISRAAELTRHHETGLGHGELGARADVTYPATRMDAAIASGSFRTMGMLVAPCTVKTMSEISTGIASNLVARAADVTLKERRRLVLMVRETPLHLGHLRSMTALTEMGAVIFPPVPAFYTQPASLAELVDHSVARALDLFGIEIDALPRWGESPRPGVIGASGTGTGHGRIEADRAARAGKAFAATD